MWLQRWRAISISIEALGQGVGAFLSSSDIHNGDGGVAENALLPEIQDIIKDLQAFHTDFKDSLPGDAARILSRWLHRAQLNRNTPGGFAGAFQRHTLASGMAALGIIRASMERHLADTETMGRSVAERAFLHLQRSIVADPEIQRRWSDALAKDEPACEKLGDVHLLSHGIWAFKIVGAGERTDLVFGEPLNLGDVQRSAPSAVVLTEWKVARSPEDAIRKLAAAKVQAQRYCGGILADFELKRTRFLVVVTSKHVDLRDDVEGNITYRAVNIATAPNSPSVDAKKTVPPT